MPWGAMTAGAISTQWNAGTRRPGSGTMWPACQHRGAPWESQLLMESRFPHERKGTVPSCPQLCVLAFIVEFEAAGVCTATRDNWQTTTSSLKQGKEWQC